MYKILIGIVVVMLLVALPSDKTLAGRGGGSGEADSAEGGGFRGGGFGGGGIRSRGRRYGPFFFCPHAVI